MEHLLMERLTTMKHHIINYYCVTSRSTNTYWLQNSNNAHQHAVIKAMNCVFWDIGPFFWNKTSIGNEGSENGLFFSPGLPIMVCWCLDRLGGNRKAYCGFSLMVYHIKVWLLIYMSVLLLCDMRSHGFFTRWLMVRLWISGSRAEHCGLKALKSSSYEKKSVHCCYEDLNRFSIDCGSRVWASYTRFLSWYIEYKCPKYIYFFIAN